MKYPCLIAALALCAIALANASETSLKTLDELKTFFTDGHPNAREISLNAIRKAEQLENPEYKAGIHRLVAMYAENPADKMDHLISALKIWELRENHFECGLILADMAELSRANQNYSRAIEYINSAHSLLQKVQNEKGLAFVYNRRAAIMFETGKNNPDILEQVLVDAEWSLRIFEKHGNDRLVFNNLNILGAALASLDRPLEALENLKQALHIVEKNDWTRVKPNILNNISSAYRKLQNWDKAIEVASESLALAGECDDIPFILSAREELYLAHKHNGDFQSALYHLELLSALKIEHYFNVRNDYIQELHVKYETHQKEHAVQIEVERRRVERLGFLFLLVSTVLVMALFLIVVLRIKNRTIAKNNAVISSQLNDIKMLYREKDRYFYRFNLIASSLNMGIFEINLKTNDIYWDSRMYSLFGIHQSPYPDPQDVISTCFDKDEQTRFETALQDAIRDRSLVRQELCIQSDRNKFKWLETQAVVTFDENDHAVSVVGTVRDISRIKQEEAEALTCLEKFHHEQKLESLNAMAGGIAHDFNNLLTVIIGNLELAKKSMSFSATLPDYLFAASNAARKAEILTDKMLDFCGTARSLPGKLDVSEVLVSDRSNLESLVPEGISVTWKLDVDMPLIRIDTLQFQQLIVNLLKNSVEAILPKTGVIRISTGFREFSAENLNENRINTALEPGLFVFIGIEDDGCGMDQITMKKMFDPFFTSKALGRGLGLASVSGIVRGHNGAILVHSNPGKGTGITVLFNSIG